MTAEDVRGDLADQADATVMANEQAAIRAALEGRDVELTDVDEARPDRIPDEARLDLGDPDDSDDPAHAGGDDIARSGSPDEDDASSALEMDGSGPMEELADDVTEEDQ
jgi:hypothetical protein